MAITRDHKSRRAIDGRRHGGNADAREHIGTLRRKALDQHRLTAGLFGVGIDRSTCDEEYAVTNFHRGGAIHAGLADVADFDGGGDQTADSVVTEGQTARSG